MPSAVEQLERDFAAQHGFSGAVAAGFCRAALRLALEAANVGGGEVLLPDFVCAQVTEAVRLAGGTPVLFRVARDLTVAPEAMRAAFTPATRAAVAVHYFGRSLESVAALTEICHERGVPLIEDCALALGVPGVGAQGDAAVFSFTKSDWCYGGGLLAARSPELLDRARAIREASFQPARALAYRYGLLRRADYAANCPTRSHAAEFAGRTLESLSGFREHGFYDAGRCDVLMPDFAARRAHRMLETLPANTLRRREIVGHIRDALGTAGSLLFQAEAAARDACAFLLLKSGTGQAGGWRERAAREEITLRLCWPAYQETESALSNATLRWLAEHLLVMEVHANLKEGEVEQIVRCLKDLAAT